MSLSSDIDAEENLLGKVVSDLQSDVEVGADGVITGTLKYLDDYTGFSGDPAEQAGNYLAVVAEAQEGDTISARLIGGQHPDWKTLDSDGILIVRVTDKDAQALEFKATSSDGSTETRRYSLSGLTLTAPAEEGGGE